jgi:sugar lactone lactonase YvrE
MRNRLQVIGGKHITTDHFTTLCCSSKGGASSVSLRFIIALTAGYFVIQDAQAAPGDLYVAARFRTTGDTNKIIRINPGGTATTFATGLIPSGLAFDRSGSLFVSDPINHLILKFTPEGNRSTFASGTAALSLAFDSAGNLFTPDLGDNAIYKFTPDGTRTTFASGLNGPSGLAFDSQGNLFESENVTGEILKFAPDGSRTTFATGLQTPQGLAFDHDGNLFVAQFDPASIFKFSPNGSRTTFATGMNRLIGLAFNSAGNLFASDTASGAVLIFSPDGTPLSLIQDVQSPVHIAFEPSATSAALNISTRMRVLTDENVLIGGFTVGGADPKKVLLRGIGPSLGNFGVTGPLQDPILELHDHTGATIATNDSWRETQQDEIIATGLQPGDDREAAVIRTLAPGAYTVIEHGNNNTTGVGLVEVYDLEQAANSILVNISTRGFVDTGNNVMIGGFIIGAGNGARVLVRGLGPSLVAVGIANALANPLIELRDANAGIVRSNDNWRDTQQTEILGSGLPPANDLEAAIITTLAPGAYTVVVGGNNGTTGVGLVEVYNLR